QNIYCGSAEAVRKEAIGLVARWSTLYTRKPKKVRDRTGLGTLVSGPMRTCKNGELVVTIGAKRGTLTADTVPAASTPAPSPRTPEVRSLSYGAASGQVVTAPPVSALREV